jgi:CBS domain-containing protein
MTVVRELMTRDVVTIEPGVSVVDAARRMIEEEKGPLPVVAGDRLVGVVTDRDLIAHVVAAGRDLESTSVQDVATRKLVTIEPDQDVAEAIRLMARNQVDRVLVVERGSLVGIISEADIRSDEGPLASSSSGIPKRRRARRPSTRRSTRSRTKVVTSRALGGAGIALQALGLKKGVELLRAARPSPPPPPRQQRDVRLPAAVFATLGVSGGAAYLTKSGRLNEIAGRFRRQRMQDVNAVQTLESAESIMESSPQENPGDPTRPVSPRPPTAP